MLFDFFIRTKLDFSNLIHVKSRVIVVYDPADDIINLPCSSFTGIMTLFAELYQRINKEDNNRPIGAKKKPFFNLLDIILSNSLESKKIELQLSSIEKIFSSQFISKFDEVLQRLFNFIRTLDVNSRIEESQILRRTVSRKMNFEDVSQEIHKFLKSDQKSKSSFDYNDKEGLMIRAFNQESNGLSEIIVKFVKFMHRLEICSLSLFDIYCQKFQNIQLLRMFLWSFFFMDKLGQVDPNLQRNYNFQSKTIKQGNLKSDR